MGKFLFIGAIMLLVAGIANIFIQSSALMITLSVLAIGIFSAFILYDLKRVQDGDETNYITATLGVYLSLYNVFSRACWRCWASSAANATDDLRFLRVQLRGALRGPIFMAGRTPPCSPRGPCAETCSPRPPACSGSRPGAPAGPASRASVAGCS
jgi:hypothetical protein